MGSTRALTRELVIGIRDCLGLETMPHFTCVGSTRDDIADYLASLKRAGIDRILALRGDPPQGASRFVPPPGGFAYANELVEFIRGIDGFSISVAGYPEGHVEAPSKEIDLTNLKRKVDAGASQVITQLFFDNAHFFDFVDRARAIGISVPIVPGIMPILNLKQVDRLAKMCGASLPEALRLHLLACGDDADAMRKVGIAWAIGQVEELIRAGVPGIHFYILNKAESVLRILEAV